MIVISNAPSARVIKVLSLAGTFLIVLAAYFCWEILYQERAIVSILKNTQAAHDKAFLHEWIIENFPPRSDLAKESTGFEEGRGGGHDVEDEKRKRALDSLLEEMGMTGPVSTRAEALGLRVTEASWLRILLEDRIDENGEVTTKGHVQVHELRGHRDVKGHANPVEDNRHGGHPLLDVSDTTYQGTRADRKSVIPHNGDGEVTSSTNGAGGNFASPKDSEGDSVYADSKQPRNCSLCSIYDLRLPLDHADTKDFECLYLKLQPTPVPICIYPPEVDVYVSTQIRNDGLWEMHIVGTFLKILGKEPSIFVVDLGANIGQYSLIAASKGHQVLAVEPYLPSVQRLQKAAQMGGYAERIVLLRNGVSDRRGCADIIRHPDNQGDVRIAHGTSDSDDANSTPKSLTAEGYNTTGSPNAGPASQDADPALREPDSTNNSPCEVRTVLLDDLLPFIPEDREVIVKIDIQGYEHQVFLHAHELLTTRSVPYILMEWSIMREMYVSDEHDSTDKRLVEDLIWTLVDAGYRAFSLVNGDHLDPAFWYGWAEDVLWLRKDKNFSVL